MDNLLSSLRILNEIGESILSEHSTEEMIDTVYQHVNQLMDAYSFAIGIYNPVSERFEFVGARENDIKLPAFSAYVHNMERFSGWMFAHQKEILINDLDAEFHLYFKNKVTPLQGMEPLSLMYVPLFYNKELIGMLSVRTMAKNAYTPQNLEILKTLAVFIGKAIGNNRASVKVKPTVLEIPDGYSRNPLSARETDVLNLLRQGMANKAIADQLFISASTVKTHTLNIYQKLQAANRMEAIIKAKAYGFERSGNSLLTVEGQDRMVLGLDRKDGMEGVTLSIMEDEPAGLAVLHKKNWLYLGNAAKDGLPVNLDRDMFGLKISDTSGIKYDMNVIK